MFDSKVKVSKIVEDYILAFKNSPEFMRMMAMSLDTVNIAIDVPKGTKDYKKGLRKIELNEFDLHKNNCAKVCFCVDMKYFYSVIPVYSKHDRYKVNYKIVSTEYKPNYISNYMVREHISDSYSFFTRLQPEGKTLDLTPYADLFEEWMDCNRLKAISINHFDYFYRCGLKEMDIRYIELRDVKGITSLGKLFKNFDDVVKKHDVDFTPTLRLPALYFIDIPNILDKILEYCENREIKNINFNFEFNTFNKVLDDDKKLEYALRLKKIFKNVELLEVKNLEEII